MIPPLMICNDDKTLFNELLTLIRRALEKRSLVKEVAYLKGELRRYRSFENMVGEEKNMTTIFRLIDTVSAGDGTVLIQGESGTGKELASRAIHNRSPRRSHPFVVISCAAIPSDLMEGILFGHERGAYTGATTSKAGKLEIADGGTVFLDDIDCLDIQMQAKLLRVIQEKEFERLGSTRVIKVDIRFVAASNKNLKQLVDEGEFREDLFYRLNVFPVLLPPLRERKGDIPLLLDHFLEVNSLRTGRPIKAFSKKSIEILMQYDWPGNVRELQNLVERLFALTNTDTIRIKDIPQYTPLKKEIKGLPLKYAVNEFEKQYIAGVLAHVDGSRKKAAEKLNIHRNTLAIKMKELNLSVKS